MRVIAGRCAGARLVAPRDAGTRPLTDRVKEALFAILQPRLEGADVLDLYAGSGAAGIEALSRGARRVVFVERRSTAAESIRANLQRIGLTESATLVVADVGRYLAGDPPRAFGVAILDPPYEVAPPASVLGQLVRWLEPGGVAVVKHFWRTEIPAAAGLQPTRTRRFGETALTFLQAAGPAARTEEGA